MDEINMNTHHLLSNLEGRPIVEDPRQNHEGPRGGSSKLQYENFQILRRPYSKSAIDEGQLISQNSWRSDTDFTFD